MSLWRNRSYRFLFSATAVSNLGDGVSALAFPWLATLITRDPVLIALVAFATRLPWFLLSIPAGAIVDRSDRQGLIVRSDWVRMGLTIAVIGLILWMPGFPPPSGELFYIGVLSSLAFLLGTAEVLRDNAAQTLLPSVVEADDLERANGQLWSAEHVMGQFVGPPLAGVLIAWAVPAPFLLDALTFAVAALAVAMMQPKPRRRSPRRPLRDDIGEAWGWMRTHPMVLRVAVVLGVMNGAAMLALTMLVLISQERLGLGAFGHGILLTAGAAGGVAGGLLGPVIIARLGCVRALRLALLLFPAAFLAIGLSRDPAIVGAALFLEAFAALLWNIVTVSWRQRIVPDALLGRVNSIYRFFGWGLTPLGAVAGGVLVAATERTLGRDVALQLPYLTGAVILTGVLMYSWRRLSI